MPTTLMFRLRAGQLELTDHRTIMISTVVSIWAALVGIFDSGGVLGEMRVLFLR